MQSATGQRNGWLADSARRQQPRSRRIPSASGKRPSAEVPLHRITSIWAPSPANAASGWRPSLLARIAFVASSGVLSFTLLEERLLHFQLNRNSDAGSRGPNRISDSPVLSLPPIWAFRCCLDNPSSGQISPESVWTIAPLPFVLAASRAAASVHNSDARLVPKSRLSDRPACMAVGPINRYGPYLSVGVMLT
jgi:hypothetical protein